MKRTSPPHRLAVTGVLALSAIAAVGAQVERTRVTGARVVSVSAAATWFNRTAASDPPEVQLLVLWRGTPGWVMRGGAQSSTGIGREETLPDGRRGPTSHTALVGGLALTAQIDADGAVARIQGRSIPLKGVNVVLVDNVDSAQGLTVSTRWVSPRLTSTDVVGSIVSRSPELYAFIGCASELPDRRLQQMNAIACAQIRGQSPGRD